MPNGSTPPTRPRPSSISDSESTATPDLIRLSTCAHQSPKLCKQMALNLRARQSQKRPFVPFKLESVMRLLISVLCVSGLLLMGGRSSAGDEVPLIDPQLCPTLAFQMRETSSHTTVLISLMRDMRQPNVANEDLQTHYDIMDQRYRAALTEMTQLSLLWRNHCTKSDR